LSFVSRTYLAGPNKSATRSWRDCDAFSFSASNLCCHSAADRADLPFQFANAGLMRVIVDNPAEGFVLPLALLWFETVFLELSPNQISFAISSFSRSVYPGSEITSIRSRNGSGTPSM
jgi:hypothetical protein